MNVLNTTFPNGGMSSFFSDKELTEFIHWLKGNESLPVKKAALIVGCQPGSSTWVFNAKIQIDGSGMIVTQPDSEYVWLNHNIADDKTKVPLDDLSPEIKTPILVGPKKRMLSIPSAKALPEVRYINIFNYKVSISLTELCL